MFKRKVLKLVCRGLIECECCWVIIEEAGAMDTVHIDERGKSSEQP